jgi:hypothetical protein
MGALFLSLRRRIRILESNRFPKLTAHCINIIRVTAYARSMFSGQTNAALSKRITAIIVYAAAVAAFTTITLMLDLRRAQRISWKVDGGHVLTAITKMVTDTKVVM